MTSSAAADNGATGGTQISSGFDIDAVRADFPILSRTVHGKPLVYLDNAATAQKPRAVIDAINEYYREYNSNIHRGVHHLSEKATSLYEGARKRAARFINAADSCEIVFLRGTTEAVNLVCSSVGQSIKAGDEIIISHMEHHSNIVPWQMLCNRTGAVLRVIPINDDAEMDVADFEALLGPKTRFVSLVHVSNSLGTINPVKQVIDLAHAQGVPVLIDGAQALPHMQVDVQALDCDFYTCSGHKTFGPMGIGFLYGKKQWLEELPPYHGGGDMIKYVSFDKTEYNDPPFKFEAGTPNVSGVIGLAAAMDYMEKIGHDNIQAHEHDLLVYATEQLSAIKGLRIIGTARNKASVVSFVLDDVHSHDIGTFVDHEGVAIRVGHHCTQPVMQRFGVPATSRASFAFYNTKQEVDTLAQALHKVIDIFGA